MTPGPRIVATGLSRTGTRSLFALLQDCGITAVHYPFDRATQDDLAAGRPPALMAGTTAILDLPAVVSYREIDAAYPGSVFLHTSRDLDEWEELPD